MQCKVVIFLILENFQRRCCTVDHNKMAFDIIPKIIHLSSGVSSYFDELATPFCPRGQSCDISSIIARCKTFKPRLISFENDLQGFNGNSTPQKVKKIKKLGSNHLQKTESFYDVHFACSRKKLYELMFCNSKALFFVRKFRVKSRAVTIIIQLVTNCVH